LSAIWFTRLLARVLPGTRVPERSGGKRDCAPPGQGAPSQARAKPGTAVR